MVPALAAALATQIARCAGGKCTRAQCHGVVDIELKKCSRCKLVAYGSTDCQRADWSTHKQQCRNVGRGAAVIELTINPATGGMRTF